MALELRAREHAVGRYSLDLLVEDSHGRTAIIENQFGQTDHDHLGKLLTYCAGTEADVVIWIAESLTEEHVAALEWLNNSTVEGVGFFGVELELLRVDGSRPAPHFRVVVRPNDWVKRVRPEPRPHVEWDWNAYQTQLNVSPQRIEVGQAMAERVKAAIEARGLPWQMTFRKGYVAFQRAGGYNVVVVDVWWNRVPRLGVKLPLPPEELGLDNPYPELARSGSRVSASGAGLCRPWIRYPTSNARLTSRVGTSPTQGRWLRRRSCGYDVADAGCFTHTTAFASSRRKRLTAAFSSSSKPTTSAWEYRSGRWRVDHVEPGRARHRGLELDQPVVLTVAEHRGRVGWIGEQATDIDRQP